MGIISFVLVVFAFVLVAYKAYQSKDLGWIGLAFWLLSLVLVGVGGLALRH